MRSSVVFCVSVNSRSNRSEDEISREIFFDSEFRRLSSVFITLSFLYLVAHRAGGSVVVAQICGAALPPHESRSRGFECSRERSRTEEQAHQFLGGTDRSFLEVDPSQEERAMLAPRLVMPFDSPTAFTDSRPAKLVQGPWYVP